MREEAGDAMTTSAISYVLEDADGGLYLLPDALLAACRLPGTQAAPLAALLRGGELDQAAATALREVTIHLLLPAALSSLAAQRLRAWAVLV